MKIAKTESIQLREPATINPYVRGLELIAMRLRWDLHPSAWSSRRRLRRLHDTYSGQKAVILCNGPSLLKTDLKLIENVFTIGLNKINLLFDKSPFRPSCIVAVNPLVLEQNAAFYNSANMPLFLGSVAHRYIDARPNVMFLHSTNVPKFARDCSQSVYEGGTVTYVAMQLAFHLGFSQVALVGCDHSYATKGPPHATAISETVDRSHFDPNYFSKGMAWHLPDLAMSEMSYTLARDAFEGFGRRLVNCTEGGQLEILERQSLAAFIAS